MLVLMFARRLHANTQEDKIAAGLTWLWRALSLRRMAERPDQVYYEDLTLRKAFDQVRHDVAKSSATACRNLAGAKPPSPTRTATPYCTAACASRCRLEEGCGAPATWLQNDVVFICSCLSFKRMLLISATKTEKNKSVATVSVYRNGNKNYLPQIVRCWLSVRCKVGRRDASGMLMQLNIKWPTNK